MTATNQQMTSEQLADLSTLAVQLQAKAEANNDRDNAVMAYAVQKACAELIESRREFTAANATIHNLELQLADAEARGVEMFANSMSQHLSVLKENGEDTLIQVQVGTAERLALAFATQLRQGAKS